MNYQIIIALTLVHFIGDFYSSFVGTLLPVFETQYALNLTQIGLISGINRLLAFIVQPPVGYFADHYRTRFFILGGPLIAILCISLVGSASSFWILVLLISLGSIGSAMFHPPVAGMIATHAGSNMGLAMSIFNMGGMLAFGVGPLFIAAFVDAYGLRSMPYTMIFGLVVMIWLYRRVPFPESEGLKHLGFLGSIKEVFGTIWKAIAVIWLMMALRAFVSQSFMTFLPILCVREGYSLVSIGTMLSVYTVAGSFSGLIAGHLSDRIGFKPVMYISYAMATPCLFLLLYSRGVWLYVASVLAGFFMLAPLPLGVALAQKIAPQGKSMVSSLMMGFALGVGGFMAPLTGNLADIFSIHPVLFGIALIPILTTGLIALLPEK